MGLVYEAEHVGLARRVAIKFVVKEGVPDSALARFRREARLASRVDHPNVVHIYDVGTDGDDDYIAMEYVEGRDLDAVIREDGPLAPDRAVAIARALLAGLGAIHAQGIIHRDIKPSNVRLTAGDVVKLMDFGIARALDDIALSRTNQVPGTPLFMAPEQLRGAAVDGRADLYAVGVTLFMMLTGDTPFAGSTAEVVAKHVYDAPPALPATVPEPLRRVVERSLAKSPDERFADANAFIAALGGESAVEPRAHAPRWPWLVLVLVVGAAAAVWILAIRPHDAAAPADAAIARGDASAPDTATRVIEIAIDAASVDATTHDAGARRTSATAASHGPVSSTCQCIPTGGPDVVALCPTKGPALCRCDNAAGRSLCPTPLEACKPTADAVHMEAARLHKADEEICIESHGTSDGLGCPDHIFDRFHTPATHGDACTGYFMYSRVEGAYDPSEQRGKWYCDVCSSADTHSYTGRAGDRCDGFYWHTGQPLTGTLQHCD
jgi:hypothetical protein